MAHGSRLMAHLRIGILGLTLLGILFGQVHGVAAEQVYGGSYESETYGFSFQWDEGLWNATPTSVPGAEGLDTESVYSTGTIYATPTEAGEPDCYEGILEQAESGGDGWRSAPASYKRPSPGGDVQGELFVVAFVQGDAETEILLYIGCRMLNDGEAVLNVILGAQRSAYLRESNNWQRLLGTIEVDDDGGDGRRNRHGSDLPTIGIGPTRGEAPDIAPETGLSDNAYINVETGFELSWDASYWTARELEQVENLGQGVFLEGETSYVLISSHLYRGADPESCVEEYAEGFAEGAANFEAPRRAPARYERPKLAKNAAGELYAMEATNKGVDVALYIECRVIPETHAIVVFHFMTGIANYSDELPAWQEVLDSVETLPLPEG